MVNASESLLADRRFAWASALARDGDHVAAADLFAQITELAPDWAPAWFALGEALGKSGDRSGAVAAFSRCAALDREGRLGATLALATLDAAPLPARAPAAYVAKLFDDYAGRFDSHLVETLGYRAPRVLREAVDRIDPDRRFAHAVDLGCGTGLMGEAIRDRVERLTGIDLSVGMIARAREKRIYDDLHVGDLIGGLDKARDCDLVLAADVLVYVGDLMPVLHAAHDAMASRALFAFTLQSAPGETDVTVGEDRRFAHGENHVRDLATAAGFELSLLASISTRRDAGQDVPGYVVVLRRP